MKSIKTFLMFQGRAKEALALYENVFRDFKTIMIEYQTDADGNDTDQIKQAIVSVSGVELMCIDSPTEHAFDFTPSMSLFVECDDEAEINELFAGLSEGGQVMMPLDNYGFSTKFAWASDPFGISWQLNLP